MDDLRGVFDACGHGEHFYGDAATYWSSERRVRRRPAANSGELLRDLATDAHSRIEGHGEEGQLTLDACTGLTRMEELENGREQARHAAAGVGEDVDDQLDLGHPSSIPWT